MVAREQGKAQQIDFDKRNHFNAEKEKEVGAAFTHIAPQAEALYAARQTNQTNQPDDPLKG